MTYTPFKMKRGANPSFKSLGSSTPNPGDSPLEKFDWGSALSGAVKGAKAGSVAGPWGMLAGAIGGGAVSGFTGGAKIEKEEAAADLATKSAEEKDQMLLKVAENAKKNEGSYSGFDTQTT